MTANTILIPFSLNSSDTEYGPIRDMKPPVLMRALLAVGWEYIHFVDLPGRYSNLLSTNTADVELWVDDDAKEIAASYLELEEIASRSAQWTHYVFLRDGVLQITAESRSDMVDLCIERCPGLNKLYLSQHLTSIPISAYLSTWRKAAAILVSASRGGEERQPLIS